MNLDWLKSPLKCNKRIVMPAIVPALISDADLPVICLRMKLILDSIEFERCEGRLINLEIYNPVDQLASDLMHKENNRLSDWLDTISNFGEYYGLYGNRPIDITKRAIEGYKWLFDGLKIPFPEV